MLSARSLSILAITTVNLVSADLSIFCSTTAFPELPAQIRSFEQYKQCDSTCECYTFELLCVKRAEQDASGEYTFSLESTDYDSVQACASDSSCICNYQPDDIWSETSQINNGVALPKPSKVNLPSYDVLKSRAESGLKEREYEKDLFNEMSAGSASRPDHVVIHPINEAFYGDLPDWIISSDVATIDTNCDGVITCDLYYELDWSVRLRQESMQCAEVVALDPCFATNACICDTGYFKIAETMPAPPSADEEKADDQVIEIDQEKLVKAQEELEEKKAAEAAAVAAAEQAAAEEAAAKAAAEAAAKAAAEAAAQAAAEEAAAQAAAEAAAQAAAEEAAAKAAAEAAAQAAAEAAAKEAAEQAAAEAAAEAARQAAEQAAAEAAAQAAAEAAAKADAKAAAQAIAEADAEAASQAAKKAAVETSAAEAVQLQKELSVINKSMQTTKVQESSVDEDKIDLETWITGAVAGALVILMIFFVICFFFRRVHKHRKLAKSLRSAASLKQSALDTDPKTDQSKPKKGPKAKQKQSGPKRESKVDLKRESQVDPKELTSDKGLPTENPFASVNVTGPGDVHLDFKKDEEKGKITEKTDLETDRVDLLNIDRHKDHQDPKESGEPNFAPE